MRKLVSLLCLLVSIFSFSQNQKIDQAEAALAVEDYDKAYLLAKESIEKIDYTDPVQLGVLNRSLDIYWNLAKDEEFKEENSKAIDWFEQQGRGSDTSLVTFYANLAGLNYAIGLYEEAINQFVVCKDILETNKLKTSEAYAQIENNLGLIYSNVGEFKKSIKSLKYAEQYFLDQDDYLSLAFVYSNLGNSFHSLYNYNNAELYYKKSLNQFAESELKNTENHLNQYLNLSTLYSDLGNFNEALECVSQGKAKVVSGSVLAAKFDNNLGVVYKNLGKYTLAESQYVQSLKLKKILLGTSHPDYLTGLNNLAVLEMELGRYSDAEENLQKLTQQLDPSTSPLLSTYYSNLAVVYQKENRLNLSQENFNKSLEITDVFYGKKGVEYISTTLNLISLYLYQDKYKEAEQLLKPIGSEVEELLLEDQINYYNSLATIYLQKGDYTLSTQGYQKALEISENIFDGNHPQVAEVTFNLGMNYAFLGEIDQASEVLSNALNNLLSIIEFMFPSLTEHEKELYIATIEHKSNFFYDFTAKNQGTNPDLITQSLNFRLRIKSLVLRSTNLFEKRINQSNDQGAIDELRSIKKMKALIAKLSSLTKEQIADSEYPLEEQKQSLKLKEKEFYQKYGVKYKANNLSLNWQQLQERLEVGEAAVEIIRYYNKKGFPEYIAIITKPNSNSPILVNLVIAADDFLFYYNMTMFKSEDLASYKIFWSPIKQELSNVNHVFFSPDGVYHKMNINALENPESKVYLMDELHISLVYTLNDVNTHDEQIPIKKISLYGHPEYYLDLEKTTEDLDLNQSPKKRTISPDFIEWTDLPGTKIEVESIRDILKKNKWDVSLYTEENALENYVKEKNLSGALHFATHGWFEKEKKEPSFFNENFFENPLTKTGLVLSGGGLHLSPLDIQSSNFEDGLLHANEVQFLNLSKTKLVVMSACQSGLGSERNEEGIYGLQRAFKIAGTEALIMSIWEVDDEATKQLMISFYTYLGTGNGIDESYRSAMVDLRKEFPQPYYWSSFVLKK